MHESPKVDRFSQLIIEGKIKDPTDEEVAKRDEEAGHVVLTPCLETNLKYYNILEMMKK